MLTRLLASAEGKKRKQVRLSAIFFPYQILIRNLAVKLSRSTSVPTTQLETMPAASTDSSTMPSAVVSRTLTSSNPRVRQLLFLIRYVLTFTGPSGPVKLAKKAPKDTAEKKPAAAAAKKETKAKAEKAEKPEKEEKAEPKAKKAPVKKAAAPKKATATKAASTTKKTATKKTAAATAPKAKTETKVKANSAKPRTKKPAAKAEAPVSIFVNYPVLY